MNHRLLYLLGIIAVGMASVTTTSAQMLPKQSMPAPAPALQEPATPGPYYAMPSWSQKLPTTTRFVILSDWDNAAVLDKETGLVWERAPVPQARPYGSALVWCLSRNVGNRGGWRLPQAAELGSLVDPSVISYPTLPAGHPFLLPPQKMVGPTDYGFWSSSIYPMGSRLEPFSVSFGNVEQRFTFPGPEGRTYTWCVRGPGEMF